MNPDTRELLAYLHRQRHETFPVGRIDRRRYFAREFPAEFPMLLSLQAYPGYRRMIGKNWMHWHDYYECIVALSGHGEFQCGSDRIPFSTGDLVLTDPLKIHGVVSMQPSHTALVILFHAPAVDRVFLAPWDQRPERTLPRLRGEDAGAGAIHGAVLHLARAWFDEEPTPARARALRFHLTEFLFHLSRSIVGEGAAREDPALRRAQSQARLRRALDYIARHGQRSLAQPEVARAVGMSTSRFRAFFKETTGWGFENYLREVRVERAARLLRETAESVAAIAQATGFADQSHLQRSFKAKEGISPLAYRKHHLLSEAAGD